MRLVALLLLALLFAQCQPKNLPVVSPSPPETGTLPAPPPTDTLVMKVPAEVVLPDPDPDPAEAPAAYVVASIRRTSCYGNCPAYEATLLSDGTATYVGKHNVPKIGTFQARVDAAMMDKLRTAIFSHHYLDLNEEYPTTGRTISDFPTTYTAVQLDGHRHAVKNNHDAPEALRDFEGFLDVFFAGLFWEKIQ